jgi:hypothetical protein
MARWAPDKNDPITGGEQIGRRLFDEPKLAGGPDQKPFKGLEVSHFVETRDPEFSLDRLGRGAIEKAVVRYLTPRAEKHGGTFTKPKRFDGWAYLSAQKLRTAPWPLHVSQVETKDANGNVLPWSDDDLDQNKFHAHVVIPIDMERDVFALRVREHFADHGGVFSIRPVAPAPQPAPAPALAPAPAAVPAPLALAPVPQPAHAPAPAAAVPAPQPAAPATLQPSAWRSWIRVIVDAAKAILGR